MDSIELAVKEIVSIGTAHQSLAAQRLLAAAYNEFAETMGTAALPKSLNGDEKTAMKKSFDEFAAGMKEKADALSTSLMELEASAPEARAVASVAMDPVAKEYF